MAWIAATAGRVTDLLLAEVLLSCVVAVIVWLLCRLLGRRAPALQQALWLLVLLRLVLPPGLSHPLGAGSLLTRMGLVAADPPVMESTDQTAGVPATSSEGRRVADGTISVALATLWLAGTVALLGFDVRRVRVLRRLLAESEPVTDPLALRLVDRWRRCLGIRRPVRLVTGDRAVSPFTDGVARPVVFLPAALLRCGSRRALAATVGHELAHVARGDVLLMRVSQVVARVYFFHPVVWFVSRRLHALREGICDHLATSQGLLSPRLYVLGLLDLLQLDLQGVEAPSLTLSQRRILMRLESVLVNRRRRAQRSLPALLCAGTLGFFLLPLASAPQATGGSAEGRTPSEESTLADPLPAGKVTRRFGKSQNPLRKVEEMHKGIDLAAPHGTPISCAEAGTVEIATERYLVAPAAGTVVVVDHGGRKTFYSHLSSLSVEVGQKVARGQVVGRVGNSGVSTGPHLHFEVWEGETHIDPAKVIPNLATR